MQSINTLNKYSNYLEKAIYYYIPKEQFIRYFNRVPLSRYHTYKYVFCHFEKNNFKNIVELGTSRSFVDGRFEGCNMDDIKYWEPNNPEKWDWSAGCFTRVASICLGHIKDLKLNTVDIEQSHINRCKYMNKDCNNIIYNTSSSEDFLKSYDGKIDLLYLDTGDMTPIETTAQLHLREVKIIVERDLISKNGIILIDDIRSTVPYQQGVDIDMGKGYLSIPYLLENGFILKMDEYQTVLIKQ